LFSDVLSSAFRSSTSHDQIALLLTSDEINIFGVAKYVRTVANRGAGMSIASLSNTRAEFPGVNLGLFAGHSGSWPDDNIRVLGMYYTSRAWTDDVRSAGWVPSCSRRIAMRAPPVFFRDGPTSVRGGRYCHAPRTRWSRWPRSTFLLSAVFG
jgi:hypothetical protein